MKKRRLLVAGAVVWLLVALPLAPTLKNNWRSNQLASHLAAAELPSSARLLKKGSRVFNGGNGNGCDYQGFVIISYAGEVFELQQAYMVVLETLSAQIANAEVYSGPGTREAVWGGKIVGASTELYISPNIDASPLYLISLTLSARAGSLDLRCT